MLNPNKLLAGMIAIGVLSLCAGALLFGTYFGHTEVFATPAKFKIGDCYRATPPLHRWLKADGQVFDMDATTYLVVGALSLRYSTRPIEPAYLGAEREIAAFDRQYEPVGCPAKW